MITLTLLEWVEALATDEAGETDGAAFVHGVRTTSPPPPPPTPASGACSSSAACAAVVGGTRDGGATDGEDRGDQGEGGSEGRGHEEAAFVNPTPWPASEIDSRGRAGSALRFLAILLLVSSPLLPVAHAVCVAASWRSDLADITMYVPWLREAGHVLAVAALAADAALLVALLLGLMGARRAWGDVRRQRADPHRSRRPTPFAWLSGLRERRAMLRALAVAAACAWSATARA
mmetsp:Transcript_100256/g.321517  ORF Transcript_100256/g.321517 Transcript_100256/m.321517 type:complete len:233 (+) Transcript_100256:193-891(+)